MCVRECGAKWREINARLRYAVSCALFTLLQLLKKKENNRRQIARECRIDGRRNSFHSIP